MWIEKYGYDLTFFEGIFMGDELKPVVAVEIVGSVGFEEMCKEYFDSGYIMSSSNCFILPEMMHFQTKYVAIFVLPEVLGIEGCEDCSEYDEEDMPGDEWKKSKKEEK